jgi:hypothetical protein
MIQSEFRNKPGESLVMQKLYCIVGSEGQILTKENWTETVTAGSTVAMSMLMRNLRVRKGNCPRPNCSGSARAVCGSQYLLQWYVDIDEGNGFTHKIIALIVISNSHP